MLPQEIFHLLYEHFEGHTWYLQNDLNHLYEQRPAQVSLDVINECIAEIVLSESDDYKRHYNLLTSNQQQLHYPTCSTKSMSIVRIMVILFTIGSWGCGL